MTDSFTESRWRFALAWLVLASIIFVFSYAELPFTLTYLRWLLRALAAAVFGVAFYKLGRPRAAVVLSADEIQVKGLRAGWWKLFQRWTNVNIPDRNIIDIRIGRIRERSIFGFRLPPLGEPSKSRSLQSFLWIRYKVGQESHEIYYPDIYDIQNPQRLVTELRKRFGSKVTVY
jgi:hypothetical protein